MTRGRMSKSKDGQKVFNIRPNRGLKFEGFPSHHKILLVRKIHDMPAYNLRLQNVSTSFQHNQGIVKKGRKMGQND
jgi:hypothetical protein